MQKNRLGCFTGTGILATLVTLFAIAGVAFASGSEMFAAGPLNAEAGNAYGGVTSHAQIAECRACHTAPWERETMADRCLACHTDIAQQMFDVAKLHGAITNKSPNLPCRDCHPEHRGPSAPLTDLGNNEFPHEVLGYSLNGHRFKVTREPFVCRDCHPNDIAAFASDSCLNCHRQMDIAFAQAHLLSFGTDCLACHDGVDRYGDDFDHNKFVFQLTGGHADVSCTKCHLDARTIADLQSAPQDCFSCHYPDDPHGGRFGGDCAACHSISGWKPAKFDHNLSAFKLEGEHAEAACEECHRNGVYAGTPSDCYSCHQRDDEHNGRFGTNCAACHSPFDWDDAAFDHNAVGFPLTGGHANVACERCHAGGQFSGISSTCVSCHSDPQYHAGMFGTSCADCHSTNDWSAVYRGPHPGIADEGGSGVNHGGTTCRTCHTSSLRTATCTACHEGNNFEDEEGDD